MVKLEDGMMIVIKNIYAEAPEPIAYGVLYHNLQGELVFNSRNSCFQLENTEISNNNRTCSWGREVLEVWSRTPCNCDCFKPTQSYRTLLFRYEKPKKLTVSEIEKILGYPVEIILEECEDE